MPSCFLLRAGGLFVLLLLLSIPPHVAADHLFFTEDVQRDTFWCPSNRCFLMAPLEGDDELTNECETDEECRYYSIFNTDCGLPYDYTYYAADANFYCVPRDVGPQKYCTIGCRMFFPPTCDDGNPYHIDNDNYTGTMHYCGFYNSTDFYPLVIPVCPCHLHHCDILQECE